MTIQRREKITNEIKPKLKTRFIPHMRHVFDHKFDLKKKTLLMPTFLSGFGSRSFRNSTKDECLNARGHMKSVSFGTKRQKCMRFYVTYFNRLPLK